MKPTLNYVLVTEVKQESTTASGIVLTGSTDKGTVAGYVQAVGPLVEGVKSGDRVAVDWAKGLKITHEGTSAALVPEGAIYGIY
jgi:co-chaperonin GroES (HSP10)